MFYIALWTVWGLWNLLTMCIMGLDKYKAIQEERRISERTLFVLATLWGGVGAWLGMIVFRHKTRHWYFVVGFTLLALWSLAAPICLTVLPKVLG